MDWFSHVFSTVGLIFALIDPPGYVPLFLTLTANDSEDGRKRILRRACTAAFVVLALFTFVGNYLLTFFNISIPALQISGGLILLAIGFEMLNMLPRGEKTTRTEQSEASTKEDVSIIPLAVPMLSGPASIVAVIVLAARDVSLYNYTAVLASIGFYPWGDVSIVALCNPYSQPNWRDRVESGHSGNGLIALRDGGAICD